MNSSLWGRRNINFVTRIGFITSLGLSQASALTIELDYGYDTGSDNFFGTNAAAKAAVEQAAADIGALITTELAPVTESYAGTFGFTTTTFNWDYLFTNPTNGTDVTISSPSLAANTVRVFVGVQELTGTTLATGGPSGGSFTLSASGTGSQWQESLDAAGAASNAGIGRGGGPVINNVTGTAFLGGTPGTYNVDLGVGVGNLWFDVDTDNKKGKDSDATLDNFWHFDHTTAPAAGKYDFYSIALHEILHSLGMGLSDTWDDQVSGLTNWTGSEAISINGTGNGLIESGSGHIATGTKSVRLSDGTLQVVAMATNINQGERRELTELDVAFLVDLGYTTVPEPSGLILIGSAFPCLLFRRKKERFL